MAFSRRGGYLGRITKRVLRRYKQSKNANRGRSFWNYFSPYKKNAPTTRRSAKRVRISSTRVKPIDERAPPHDSKVERAPPHESEVGNALPHESDVGRALPHESDDVWFDSEVAMPFPEIAAYKFTPPVVTEDSYKNKDLMTAIVVELYECTTAQCMVHSFNQYMKYLAHWNYGLLITCIAGVNSIMTNQLTTSSQKTQFKELSDKIIHFVEKDPQFKEYMKQIVNQIKGNYSYKTYFSTYTMPHGQLQYLKDILLNKRDAFNTEIMWPENLNRFIKALEA